MGNYQIGLSRADLWCAAFRNEKLAISVFVFAVRRFR